MSGHRGDSIAYAEDTQAWEAWQVAYRYGVLVIFPPEPLRSVVDELRARLDPRSAATIGAHITLTVPLPRPLDEDDLASLLATAAGIPALEVEYGPVTNYLPHPGVVLRVGPEEALKEMVEGLEASPCFRGAAQRPYPFSPHMTLAEFISVERTEELTAQLRGAELSGSFVCDHVSLAVPDQGFHLSERARLPLAARTKEAP